MYTALEVSARHEDLCSECQKIDFDYAFGRRAHGAFVLAQLGPVNRFLEALANTKAHDKCVLCQMFARMFMTTMNVMFEVYHSTSLPESITLMAAQQKHVHWFQGMWKGRRRKANANFKAFALQCIPTFLTKDASDAGWTIGVNNSSSDLPGGMAICYRTPQNCKAQKKFRPPSPHFDVEIASFWYETCKKHHPRYCIKADEKVTRLKLIDCSTRSIDLAPPTGSRYVALSYVWGSSHAASSARDTSSLPILPKTDQHSTSGQSYTFAKTIEDAIKVTQALGLNYLWVDQLCIDQSNPHEKHELCQQMDVIYRGAELTIIAACGQDMNFGLPGVGNTPRIPIDFTINIPGFTFTTSRNHPERDIKTSKWSSRGWTYQEAALSVRRLVFTLEQTYFECYGGRCCEHTYFYPPNNSRMWSRHPTLFSNPSSDLYPSSESMYRRLKLRYVLTDPYKDIFHDIWRFTEHVHNYSRRELTFDSDALKAFTGIMGHFRNLFSSIHHLYGIPYAICAPLFSRAQDESLFNVTLAWGLCWNCHRESSLKATSAIRRLGFPSWSWAGWKAEVGWSQFERVEQSYVKEVRLLLSTPTETRIATFLDLPLMDLSTEIRIKELHFQAHVLPKQSFRKGFPYGTTSKGCTVLQDGFAAEGSELYFSPTEISFNDSYLSLLQTGQVCCVFMMMNRGYEKYVIHMLVIQREQTGDSDVTWRRIGKASLHSKKAEQDHRNLIKKCATMHIRLV